MTEVKKGRGADGVKGWFNQKRRLYTDAMRNSIKANGQRYTNRQKELNPQVIIVR